MRVRNAKLKPGTPIETQFLTLNECMRPLKEVVALFLKLGMIAFGGPAAHIAMMQDEVVNKRKWMSRQHFLDLVGATNLIPGPNSTEMVMHCGLQRAGGWGLVLGGAAFILPATLITGILAYVYVQYQSIPALETFLFGIKPAVIAIIWGAVYQLGKKALKSWQLGVVGALVAAASFAGINEVLAILGGGLFGSAWWGLTQKKDSSSTLNSLWIPVLAWLNQKSACGGALFAISAAASDISLLKLFLIFLKIGLVLFGSGYVLIAYLEGEFVQNLGWLTQAQLLDAVAVGQFTPGPVLSTATFIGYQMAGVWGAIVATVGIFLPSFILVALLNPVIPRLRESKMASAFLDAVNISAMGIMAAVTVELGISVLTNWQAWLIFLLSCAATFGFKKISSVWIVLGSACLGYILTGL